MLVHIKVAPLEDVKVFPDLPYETMPFAMESVGTSYPDKNYLMERSSSDVSVFEYVVKGSGSVMLYHNEITPQAGDSYLLLANEAHKYHANADDPWEKIWINVRGCLVSPILQAYGLNRSMLLPGLDLSGYIKRIHEIAFNPALDTDTIMDRSFLVFLEMCQFISNNLPSDNGHKYVPANMLQLKQHIDDHLSQHLDLAECTKITYLSISQTIRNFRAAYGVTPYEYLNQRRISTAKLLLTNSALSIEEIAAQTGFPDRNYFSKYFKRKVGMSPRQFRESPSKEEALDLPEDHSTTD